MSEQWRDIPGWNAKYQASNLGQIRLTISIGGFEAGHIKKQRLVNTGYVYVRFRVGKKQVKVSVHRLVMLAFIGECPPGYEVNHKNGIKTDNRLVNLEYVTRLENMIHRSTVLNMIGSGNRKLSVESVIAIWQLLNDGHPQRAIARQFGVTDQAIRRIRRRETWSYVTDHIAIERD